MTTPETRNASAEEVLRAALDLFARQGYGATTMRQIAQRAGTSLGNVYHHFRNKEEIFATLIDRYFQALLDPDLELNRIFARARFPEDLEEMAEAIEDIVERYGREIMLIYIDVIEFSGKHVRWFYETMAQRFHELYDRPMAEKKARGELADVDPVVAVMLAVRWFFYFFTVEKYFGVPMHFGMEPRQAVHEFSRLLRCGLLPRADARRWQSGRGRGSGKNRTGRGTS